jgi:hypothetical protein
VERLEHIVGWFDKYLQGMSKPEYDDVGPAEVSPKSGETPGKQPPSTAPNPPKK